MERIRIWLSRGADLVLGGRRAPVAGGDRTPPCSADRGTEAHGMSDADARLAARREFGGIERLRITHRQPDAASNRINGFEIMYAGTWLMYITEEAGWLSP